MAKTNYEKQLGFNALTRWLHSHRYRHAFNLLSSMREPIRVMEIGCSEGKLFDVLNERFDIDYVGVEIRHESVEIARARHEGVSNFRVYEQSAVTLPPTEPDIVFALETLEHIPEHDVVRIVEAVAAMRPKLFVCSVPIEVGPAIWLKNLGSAVCGYNRHREYTWAETLAAGLYQMNRLPAHDTGHKGFDWRWLAQTIRHNMRIVKLRHLPLPFLPTAMSTNMFMVAAPQLDVVRATWAR